MEDIAQLINNRQHLATIAKSVSTLTPSVGLRDVARLIAEKTSYSPDDVHRTLRTIWNLRRVADSLQIPPAELPETIIATLEKYAPTRWKHNELEEWRKTIPEVAAFLEQLNPEHPLNIGRKAEQLAYLHQNVLTTTRVVTDVRPVFDVPAQRILEALVLHTLFIEYSDGDQDHRIAFALDADDLAQLRRLCDRAELKAGALKAAMREMKLPTAIIGEKSNPDESGHQATEDKV
jgi:hypothetical protein